VFPSHPS